MRICFECKKIFCKDCLSSHNKSNPNHHLNTIDNADINCPLHKSKYTYFCSECKKNLCDECVKDKKIRTIEDINDEIYNDLKSFLLLFIFINP